MSSLLLRSRGRIVAFALEDVLEVVRTVAMVEPSTTRWRGVYGRFDWRGVRVLAYELPVRLDGAAPRPLAEYVDGHIVIVAAEGAVVGFVVERAETIVDEIEAGARLKPEALLSVRERRRLLAAQGADVAAR
jgi:chemotaxis signal transduction protein